MAGLIEQQMGGAPAEEQMQPGMDPGMEMEEGGPDESDPTFQAGLEFMMEALYGAGAAKNISKQLKAAPTIVQGMADVAYDITAIVDEKTGGNIPDELLVPMAMKALEEVVEIADASNLNPQPEDVALAFKTMILRYMQEQGVDTTQLDQAMSQVDPSAFRKLAEGGEGGEVQEEAGEVPA